MESLISLFPLNLIFCNLKTQIKLVLSVFFFIPLI